MKPPKNPSKEPSLPSQDESRRTNILLEKLMSEFRTFGESLSIVRGRVDRMEPDLRAVKADVADIKADLKQFNQRPELVEAKFSS